MTRKLLADVITVMPSSDEQRQREELALQHVALGDVGPRVDQRDHHRHRGEERQQVAHRVGDDHAAACRRA